MLCTWERCEIALEKLINLLDTDNTDMWNGSTYTDHKTKTVLNCLLHPFSALFLDAGVKTFFIKKPLHNIFGHRTCTHPVLARRREVLSNMF